MANFHRLREQYDREGKILDLKEATCQQIADFCKKWNQAFKKQSLNGVKFDAGPESAEGLFHVANLHTAIVDIGSETDRAFGFSCAGSSYYDPINQQARQFYLACEWKPWDLGLDTVLGPLRLIRRKYNSEIEFKADLNSGFSVRYLFAADVSEEFVRDCSNPPKNLFDAEEEKTLANVFTIIKTAPEYGPQVSESISQLVLLFRDKLRQLGV